MARKTLAHSKVLLYFAQLPPCLIGTREVLSGLLEQMRELDEHVAKYDLALLELAR